MNRRSLLGLLGISPSIASAMIANQTPQITTDYNSTVALGSQGAATPSTDWIHTDIKDQTTRLRDLLKDKDQLIAERYARTSKESWLHMLDPDLIVNKSMSLTAKNMIQAKRQAIKQYNEEHRWTKERLEELKRRLLA